MASDPPNFQLLVLYAYFCAQRLSRYHDPLALKSTLISAVDHCAQHDKLQHLVVFTVIQAELSAFDGDFDNLPKSRLKEQFPTAFHWYREVLNATTSNASAALVDGELKVIGPSRNNDLSKISGAIGDEYGAMVTVAMELANKKTLHDLLKAAGVPQGA